MCYIIKGFFSYHYHTFHNDFGTFNYNYWYSSFELWEKYTNEKRNIKFDNPYRHWNLFFVHFPYLDFPFNHSCSFTIDGLTWKHWEYILYARTPVKTNVSLSRKNLRITRAKRFLCLLYNVSWKFYQKTVTTLQQTKKSWRDTRKTIRDSIRKYTCYKNCQHPMV